MRGGRAIAIGVALAFGMPGLAHAATVSVESTGKSNELFYRAAAGERNAVVASTDGAVVTFSDTRAEITPGDGCVGVTERRATCDFVGFARVNMELKNRRDRGRVNGAMILLKADGGGGADRLTGSGLFDQLDGGHGPDVLNGRGSPDSVSYAGRADDLRVTLGDGRRNDGGPRDGPKRDRLRSISHVLGGDGDDLLAGNDGENDLASQAGNDVLRGRGGHDNLYAGDGRDRLSGGGGDDLFAPSAGRDRAFGGRGSDYFQMGLGPNGADLYLGGRGKDTVQTGFFADVRITLAGGADDGPCSGSGCTDSDEGDDVRQVEEIEAGQGDDLLIGSKRDEIFRPSSGADVVRARGGDDRIFLAIDGIGDIINCGAGIDQIIGTPDATDQNHPSCE